MSTNSVIKTHRAALEIYNRNKTAADPSYIRPVYLAKAMIANGLGTINIEGRTKFSHGDVMKYLKILESNRQRRAARRNLLDPRNGVSPEYIAYLRR